MQETGSKDASVATVKTMHLTRPEKTTRLSLLGRKMHLVQVQILGLADGSVYINTLVLYDSSSPTVLANIRAAILDNFGSVLANLRVTGLNSQPIQCTTPSDDGSCTALAKQCYTRTTRPSESSQVTN